MSDDVHAMNSRPPAEPARPPDPASASTTPRIAPGQLRDTGVLPWLLAHAGGVQARTTPLNIFATLGKHRKLFRGWLHFAGRLMPGGILPRRETELVILRVAHLRACTYELDHHRHLGRRAGLDDADLARVQRDVLSPEWSPRELALLSAVDMMHHEADLDDPTWAALRGYLDERECIEFCLLVGHYEMLATVLGTLRIQPDLPTGGRFRRRPL